MKKLLLIHVMFFIFIGQGYAQRSDTTSVDSTAIEMDRQGVMEESARDTSAIEQKNLPEAREVVPWQEERELNEYFITNDSLMRWQLWPNWGDFQSYRRDAISFRQGTIGRVDAFHVNGYEPYEQQLEMEGLSLNNPITGLPNYNLVPHRKIGEAVESYGGNYYSNIRIRDFYVVKPISYLNYDEDGEAFRNLEFLVAQNFTEKTNVEVSYWDRRGGGYYPNSEVTGNQITARAYHHLNENYLVRALYLRNQLNKGEPFGYSVGDPSSFPFNEFTSAPVSGRASSEYSRWDLITGIYQRKDTASAESGGLEFSVTKNKHDLYFSADTLSRDIRTLGTRAFKSLQLDRFEIRGEISAKNHKAEAFSPISLGGWTDLQSEVSGAFKPIKNVAFFGSGIFTYRSDGMNGFDITGGIKSSLFDRLQTSVSISTFSKIPTIQAMYWQSENYVGNEGLNNELGVSAVATLDFELTSNITVGGKGRFKLSGNASFLTQDSSFTNSRQLQHISGSAYARFENHLFEIESSGIFQQFQYSDTDANNLELNGQDQVVWLRNSAFVKGYMFDRATYLKLGVKTLLSPLFYGARTFNTELGYWQGNSTYQELPAFFRMDVELSARLRGIMIVMRWENALDGYGQAGYFEAAGFPMPPRRLLVGIRAQFRN
ncbi:putative porin [Gracilimonas halophila]|uniref:Porin n=1 Tax=Gracilimonas halophila TaxID=1834464 RepID=A0ABW5JM14_9BACT